MEKVINLQWRPTKSHKNHLDNWNHFTEEGQVGEYPEDVAKEKLADFPDNFVEYKQPAPATKKAKPQPGNPIKDEKPEEPKKVEDEPDKALKDANTKRK